MRLVLEPVWSWPVAALAAVALLTIALGISPSGARAWPARWRRGLKSLRVLAALCLIFAMLRPSVQVQETDRRQSEFAVLMDASRSMGTADAPGGLTRREALVKMFADQAPAWQKLGQEADVKLFDFSGELTPVDAPLPQAAGQMTIRCWRPAD
jgi:hypothetical protein